MRIDSNLADELREAQLTLYDLALLTGMSYARIRHLARSPHRMRLETALVISLALGRAVDEVFKLEPVHRTASDLTPDRFECEVIRRRSQ